MLDQECLTFLGDVLPRKPYSVDASIPGVPVLNLEGPICEPLHPWPNTVNLHASGNYLGDIFGHGPLIACLANNHIMDYGEAGFRETIEHLADAEIQYFGAGSIAEQTNNPLCIAIQDITVALLGFVCPSTHPVYADRTRPGVSPLSIEAITPAIQQIQQAGIDRIVVCLHWGPEEVSLPRPGDVHLARNIIDAGADLIIGHHPHRIQPYEIYEGRYIFYSLGNCIMPDLKEGSNYDDGGQPQATFVKKQYAWHRRSLGVTYHPASRSVQMSVYHFDGERLALSDDLECPVELSVSQPEAYQRRYKRAYYLGKLQYKFHTLLTRRKIPGVKDLKSIGAIVKELWKGARESR